jgi:hypothetical protein
MTITKKQLKTVIDLIPVELLVELKRNNAMLCGGVWTSVVTDQGINDFDFFFNTETEYLNVLTLLNSSKNYKRVFESKNAVGFEFLPKAAFPQIQLIRREFSGMADTVNRFDFTCCMCGYSIADDLFYYHPDFPTSCELKSLKYNYESGSDPISSLMRITKYSKRGYFISPLEMVKISIKVSELKLNTFNDLLDNMHSYIYYLRKAEILEAIQKIRNEPFCIMKLLELTEKVEDQNIQENDSSVWGEVSSKGWGDNFKMNKRLLIPSKPIEDGNIEDEYQDIPF